MGWTCPQCGPLADRDHPLHGADNVYHCTGLTCDEAVTWELCTAPEPDRSWRSAQSAGLKKMREKLAQQGPPRKPKGEPAVSKKKSRLGQCGKCLKEKYLLKSKGEPHELRCTACFKEENPYTPGPKGKKKAAKPEPAPEPELDDIAKELKAMEACARALEGLNTTQVERVLRYVLDRHPWPRSNLLPQVDVMMASVHALPDSGD